MSILTTLLSLIAGVVTFAIYHPWLTLAVVGVA